MIKLIIYLIFSISVLGTSIISPAMGTLSAHFSDVNQTLVQLILTIPALTVIFSCFFSIKLTKKFGKKNTLLFALFLYGFAGCASAFAHDIYSMLFFRALLGVGIGILMPLSQTLPSDFFKGTERQIVYARAGSSISLGNMVFITLAGILASYSWNYTFAIYLVGFIVMLVVFFFLPKHATIIDKEEKTKAKALNPQVYLVGAALFIFMATVYVLFANLAILMDKRNIGTVAMAGYILATNSLVSFFISFNLVKIRKILGKYIYPLVPLLIVCAHALIYFSDSVSQLFIAQICNAIAMGITMPLSSIAISEFSDKSNITKGMAVMTVSIFLGQLASPFLSSYLPLFSGFNKVGGIFFTIAIFMSLIFFITLFYVLFLFPKAFACEEQRK